MDLILSRSAHRPPLREAVAKVLFANADVAIIAETPDVLAKQPSEGECQ